MKLTILGKWSPYPPAGGACPGYLVESDGVRILLDCGPAVVASLHRVYTAFDLQAAVITHLHPDHFTDIYPLRNELAFGRLPEPGAAPLPLFSPAGAAGYLAACLPKPESRQEFTSGFMFRALEDGAGEVGGIRLRFVLTSHPMPCHAVQVSAEGRRLVYSADTGPNARLWAEAARAKNLKAIIVDTSFPNSLDGIADASGHFTPTQLRDDLNKAKVGNGVPIYVYHVKPVYEKKVTDELKALGRKNVKILQEGKTYNF